MRSPNQIVILLDWVKLLLKKENHPKVVKKEVKKVRTANLLVIIMVR